MKMKTSTHDALGYRLVDDAEYYIQDTRQFVGNSILWWCPKGQGYTCNIDEAGVYPGSHARGARETDLYWPKDYVLARTVRHVRGDAQGMTRVRYAKRGTRRQTTASTS